MPETWENQPNLSSAVAQQGVADASGGIAYSGVADSSTAGEIAFQGPTADFINYGVLNGTFAQGPHDAASNVEMVNNPLPYWYGPVQVSGGAVTVQWVTDSSSPSGYNIRFTMNPGAASDEAYVEQILPVGGSRRQAGAHVLRCFAVAGAGNTATFTAATSIQYLTSAGATTGAELTGTGSLAASGSTYVYAPLSALTIIPADALYVRVRIGMRRVVAAATDSGTIDFSDVWLDRSHSAIMVNDYTPATYDPAWIVQNNGVLSLGADGGSASLLIDSVNGQVRLPSSLTLTLTEQAAPGTPSSNLMEVYADTSGNFSIKNDDGTVASIGVSSVLPKAVAFTGLINPTITGTVNDWAPTGIATTNLIIVNLNGAAKTINGIDTTGWVEGQTFWMAHMNNGGGALTLAHAAAGSTSGMRFACPGGVNYVLPNTQGVQVMYLPTVSSANPLRVLGPVI